MYDTIVASVESPEYVDEHLFQGGKETVDMVTGAVVTRLWYNGQGAAYQPRVTYWRAGDLPQGGRMRMEFSIPKLAGIDPLGNPTAADVVCALDAATAFVRSCFCKELPDVRMWKVNRVDYAWNWTVGDDLLLYMSLVQSLHAGGMVRHPYPETQGVVWKTKQRNARWIKFYSKSLVEKVVDRPAVLRFEVSNYRKVLPYMCKVWFGCERSVAEVLRPGRGLYVLAQAWERLGLGAAATYGSSDAQVMLRLRATFGRGAAGAWFALGAMQRYGADAWRVYGLMSENTYYVWRRKLVQHGYLSEVDDGDDGGVPVLRLPVDDVVTFLAAEAAQNLGIGNVPAAKDIKKISPEISSPAELWQKIADFLQVPGAVLSRYLVREVDFSRVLA